MSSSGSNLGGEDPPKGGIVNHYLNSVMTPMKTLTLKDGVLLMEEVKAPKTEGTLEERLEALEQTVFRYNSIVERSLDAHHFMNLELEKKIEEYEERIKDLGTRYLRVISEMDRYQALMWDMENQNCEYEERFKKIAEAATLRYNDPPMSFHTGRPFPWKQEEWKEDYDKRKEEWEAEYEKEIAAEDANF
jgi:hypothetical protein